jgi:hypothetical protein
VCASEWFATRRGTQAGWTYADTADVKDKLHGVLLAILKREGWTQALHDFRNCMSRLHARPFEPFPRCAEICDQAQVCLYRLAVSDLVSKGRETQTGDFSAAYGSGKMPKTWNLCLEMAFQLVDPVSAGAAAAKRIALCYAQHMLQDRFANERGFMLDGLLNEAASVTTERGETVT